MENDSNDKSMKAVLKGKTLDNKIVYGIILVFMFLHITNGITSVQNYLSKLLKTNVPAEAIPQANKAKKTVEVTKDGIVPQNPKLSGTKTHQKIKLPETKLMDYQHTPLVMEYGKLPKRIITKNGFAPKMSKYDMKRKIPR